MGHKVNPNGFRLSINKSWLSSWFSTKENYGDLVKNDFDIRNFIKKELKTAGVEKIEIKRSASSIEILIKVARPGVVIGRGGAQIEKIKEQLKKFTGLKIDLRVMEVKNPEISAQLIALNVAEQLERRVVPKFVMSKEVEKAANSGKINGIKIWVSGRIKGTEIARTEKIQWGILPLQTISADIDYAFRDAQVPNAGKHGVKVWVYKKKENK